MSPAKVAAYRKAMLDAASDSTQKKVCRDLLAVVRGKDRVNKRILHGGSIKWEPVPGSNRVLVASLMSRHDYETYYKWNLDQQEPTYTLTKSIWVTVVPELKTYFIGKQCPPSKKRVAQSLGLNPTWPAEVILEMWVDADDLFRPSPDPEITDHEATTSASNYDGTWTFQNDSNPFLAFDSSAMFVDYNGATQMSFREWFDWCAEGSYQMPDPDDISTWGAPWTRLGYTYDLHKTKGNHQGPSEFMVRIDPAVAGGELTITLVRVIDSATKDWKKYFRCDEDDSSGGSSGSYVGEGEFGDEAGESEDLYWPDTYN